MFGFTPIIFRRENPRESQTSPRELTQLSRSSSRKRAEHNFTPQTMCTYLSTKPRCRWNGYSGKRWVLMFRSLRKEDSLEEGKPFLVVGQKVLDCATPDTFDVRLCDCVIVCCSSKSKDADAQPSPPSQTTQTTLCDQRLHSSHCFGRRLGCHMFQSILLQKVKESFCFLLATTNKKVWDWVNAILWVMNAFKFALFGIA